MDPSAEQPPSFEEHVASTLARQDTAIGNLANTVNRIATMLSSSDGFASAPSASANVNAAPTSYVLPPGVKPPVPESCDADPAHRHRVATWLASTESTLRLAGHNLNAPESVMYTASFLKKRASDWFILRRAHCSDVPQELWRLRHLARVRRCLPGRSRRRPPQGPRARAPHRAAPDRLGPRLR